jgi:hypothetical protein
MGVELSECDPSFSMDVYFYFSLISNNINYLVDVGDLLNHIKHCICLLCL